jgi:GntR family transcriptional regulator
LQLDAGSIVQRAVRVRHLHNRPFSHSMSFVIESIGRTFTREELATTPLIDLLARAGVTVGRVQQSITATLADDVSATRLGVSVGSALLKLRRVFFDTGDRIVDYVEILYQPDRFEYRMTLSRGAGNRFEIERTSR